MLCDCADLAMSCHARSNLRDSNMITRIAFALYVFSFLLCISCCGILVLDNSKGKKEKGSGFI